MNLKKFTVGASPLTGTIYLYRFGKDEKRALQKREAERDVMAALVDHMMHDAPNGASKVIEFGDNKFKISVEPL